MTNKAHLKLERFTPILIFAFFLYISFINGAGYFQETKACLYTLLIFLGTFWFLEACRKNSSFYRTDLDIPLILFGITTGVSAFGLVCLYASRDALLLIFSYSLIFWLVANNIKLKWEVTSLLAIFVLCGTLLSSYGIFQYVAGFKMLSKYVAERGLSLDIPSRVFSIFISPNHLAGFLCMLIPVAFVLLLNAKDKWQKVALLIAGVVMITCLFLTFSRGGWLCFMVVVAILVVGIPKTQRRKGAANLLLLGMFALIFCLTVITMTEMYSPETALYPGLTKEAGVTSAQGRFHLWKGTLRMIKEFPLLGTGIGTYACIYSVYQHGGIYSKHAHNTYLELFAETGVLGFALFLAIILLILKKQFGLLLDLRDEHIRGIALALFAGSVAFFVRNLIDFDWYTPLVALVFWSLVGLTFSLEGLVFPQRVVRTSFKLSRNMSAATVVVAFCLILLILVNYAVALNFAEWGKSLMRGEKFSQACVAFRKATLFDPICPEYHHHLANACYRRAQRLKRISLMDEAIREMKKAIALNPFWADYHSDLAVYYWSRGWFSQALSQLERAQDLYPNDPSNYVLLGEFHAFRGDHSMAISQFKKAISLKTIYRYWYPQRTLRYIERAHFNLGNEYVTLGELDKALREFTMALDLNPRNQTAYLGRGWIYYNRGMHREAAKEYGQVVKLNPRSAVAHFYLGLIYEKMDRLGLAMLEFEKVLEIEPENKRAKDRLAEIRKELNL